VNAVDLGPVSDADQTQRPFDLFLIFAGANLVAATLQIGASLVGTLSIAASLGVFAVGVIGGSLLVASLAPLGPRLRVPSIVASRAALGHSGAQLLALWLFVTNFAWIALNNAIAASICSRLAGGPATAPVWAVALGLITTIVVSKGPRAVSYADRWMVPMLFITGMVVTVAVQRLPLPAIAPPPVLASHWWRAFDIVFGYQVSWLLMFGDYPRYVRSARGAAVAAFFGLAVTAAWFMPLGLFAATIARSDDPGVMVFAIGLGWWGAILITIATLTVNFVNIYMSALALKSMRPATGDQFGVWFIGGLGAALGVLPWLQRFGDLISVIAGTFVPAGGVLLAHYVALRRPVVVSDLYDPNGPYARHAGWSIAGLTAWIVGGVTFYVTRSIGGTLPCLAATMATYVIVTKWRDQHTT
jgi:purine-cytosine permease-like protein